MRTTGSISVLALITQVAYITSAKSHIMYIGIFECTLYSKLLYHDVFLACNLKTQAMVGSARVSLHIRAQCKQS